uniref:E2 ubiquitin-conjugating enzyme n=1 Tax=Lygus hesperus TaxID=30085 RepID=A0A146LUN9_LYGHE
MNPRIRKEYKEIQNLPPNSQIGAIYIDGDLTHWRGFVIGPEQTPYEGGKFYIDIHIPPDYPFSPPNMKFETRVWHPNVSSQTGFICLDILKSEWSPAITLRTALLSVQALLSAPNPDDPQDGVVAAQYLGDPAGFSKTAREWTCKYAVDGGKITIRSEPPFPYPNELAKLLEMGFEEEKSKSVLLRVNGNVQNAFDYL